MIQVIRLDVGLPGHAMLAAVAADRILAFAKEHDPIVDPEALMRAVMRDVWAGLKATLVLLLVDQEASKVVGHLLGELQPQPGRINLLIAQAKADGNVGDAMKDAMTQAEQWAREAGATQSIFTTHRNADTVKRWNPKYKVARTVFIASLENEGA